MHPLQTSSGSSGKRVAFADGLRGLAALWVVLYHLSEGRHISSLKPLLPGWLAAGVFDWGHLGVAVFFVLSGFVMAFTVRQVRVDGALAGRFVLRRLIRLSPPYYLAIAVALGFGYAKAIALGVAGPQARLTDVLAHAAYLQLLLSIPAINTVFWTLCIEVQFYLAFALLLLVADSRQLSSLGRSTRLLVIGISAMFALLWPARIADYALWTGDFLGFWYSFLAGVLVCWGWIEGGKTRQAAVAYCVVLMFVGVATTSHFAIAVACTGLLLSAAGTMGTMARWLSWRWVQTLGLISYSLYLLHNPLTGASFRIVNRWMVPGSASELVGCLVALLVCLFGSWVAYRLVEQPSIGWSRSILLRKSNHRNPPLVAAGAAER